jgi:hypothetical protein
VIPYRYREVPLRHATLVHVIGRVHNAELVPVQDLGQDVMEDENVALERSASPRSAEQARRNSSNLLHAGHGGKMIIFRHMRFIYSPASQQFILQQSDVVSRRSEAHSDGQRHTSVAALKAKELSERIQVGLSQEYVADNRVLYGENALILTVPGVLELLFTEIFHPFYVFQVRHNAHT